MRTIGWMSRTIVVPVLLTVLAIMTSGCQDPGNGSHEDLPDSVGYLRSGTPRLGELVIFDADSFDVYRSVELPIAWEAYSHRLELDTRGRVWIGYAQDGMSHLDRRSGVLVLSAKGEVVGDLDLGCAPPDGGIAFANSHAFVGCAASGFSGRVYVVDLDSLEVVKTFADVHPPGEVSSETGFYITTVAEVGGHILVVGFGSPPETYPAVTNHSAAYTRVAVIDPVALEFRDWLTGLEPGLRVFDILEVDGKAWLFNELSHLEELATRTDVYVIDPSSVEIVGRFNLEHPFPTWAAQENDGVVYVLHRVKFDRLRVAGHRTGITKLNPSTGENSFVEIPGGFDFKDLDVHLGKTCMANRTLNGSENDGLWCLDAAGELTLRIPQDQATGIKFRRPP